MSKAVASIFKLLIGTAVVLVLSAIVIELYNVSLSSMQLVKMTKTSINQACTLFSQETYKKRTDSLGLESGMTRLGNVLDENGNIYISGNFYESNDEQEVYNQLYKSAQFVTWCQSEVIKKDGNWYNLELLTSALTENYSGLSDDEIATANNYLDERITPLNMGIPYLDRAVVQKIAQWNVAQVLSNCNKAMIRTDEDGRKYVYYSGFRVYSEDTIITGLEYRVFDVTDPSERQDFIRYTKINPDNLGEMQGGDNLEKDNTDRQRICLVGITYSIPIEYEGITPLKSIIAFAYNSGVQGLRGKGGVNNTGNNSGAKSQLVGGGFNDGYLSGQLPINGKLIFYVVS